MKSLLVWSGGLDSTYILLNMIKNKEEFDTFYVNCRNNEIKNRAELKAREDIIKEVCPDGILWKDFKELAFEIINIPELNSFPLWQPLFWIHNVALFFNLNKHTKYDKIIFGYQKEDDFWHYKNDFEKMFNIMWDMSFKQYSDMKKPTFEYPLEWCTKKEVYSNFLDEHGKKILNLTWTCENPRIKTVKQLSFDFYNVVINNDNIKTKVRDKELDQEETYIPCGSCVPCTSLNKAIEQFKLSNTKSEEICEVKH